MALSLSLAQPVSFRHLAPAFSFSHFPWPVSLWYMYKIFYIYLVYAWHCFSLRFTNSRAENLCQKSRRAEGAQSGKPPRHKEETESEEGSEMGREMGILFPGSCVCCLYCISTGKLPMYVMQFCCSLTARVFSSAMDTFSLSIGLAASRLFHVLGCNLIWNFCAIQQNMAQKYDQDQCEKLQRRKT